jgi:pimeloyl-ACP methyl ester carboxylesterase
LWSHQLRDLADQALITVADLTRADSITAMAESLLTAAPERFALAGHSMGGYVAFEVMRRAPQRVTRLALVNSSARADTPEQTRRRRGLITQASMGVFRGITPRLLPNFVHPDRLADQALAQTVMAMTQRVGRDVFIRQQEAIIARRDSRPGLGSIACQTLVVAGAQDQQTPPALAQEMSALIPNARLAILERTGHLAPLEQPEALTALLRGWLG